MIRLNLFAYGTLRTEPQIDRDDGWLDIHHFDPGARQMGDRGAWTLPGYDMWVGGDIPIIAPGEGTVLGDLYSVTLEGLKRLMEYEGYPGGAYNMEELTVTSGDRSEQAVVFTKDQRARLAWFDRPLPSGDYFDHYRHPQEGAYEVSSWR